MDKYEETLLNQALDLLHRIIGYSDAQRALKPPKFEIVQIPLERFQKNNKNEQGILNFTEKEILQMPKKFQKTFKTSKATAHVRLKNGKYYEIRVTIEGENYSATATSLEKAKERFIKKLYEPKKKKEPSSPIFFHYAEEWLETAVQPYVKRITYDAYVSTLNKHVYPVIGKMRLNEIDSFTLQRLINDKGTTRTCEKVFTILNTIFNYATPKEIPFSPMAHVKKPHYVQKETKPLTKDEEKEFLQRLFETNNPYRYTFVLILYTGLRRSELKTATFDENFVYVKCAKQRLNHPDKIRKIPISPMLRKYMPLGDIPTVRDDTLSSVFHDLCPNHTLHNLRKTFNVRARTCGIPKPLVECWMGHKPSRDDVNEMHYMHYEDEYQLKEILKFEY